MKKQKITVAKDETKERAIEWGMIMDALSNCDAITLRLAMARSIDTFVAIENTVHDVDFDLSCSRDALYDVKMLAAETRGTFRSERLESPKKRRRRADRAL
jgi:hypothetical protein